MIIQNLLPAVGAEDLELISVAMGWEWFVRLCNSIVWVESAAFPGEPLPVVTERRGRDRGIDARYFLPDVHLPQPVRYVRSGRNVFQYKWRDRSAYSRKQLIPMLQVTGALRALGDPPPDNYVLFTNVKLNASDHERLKSIILKGFPEPDKVHVETVGADQLATALTSAPHLRAAFLGAKQFETLSAARERHVKVWRDSPPYVGREREMAELEALLKSGTCRVIDVSGAAGAGKSRLVLEALSPFEADVLVALDEAALTPGLFEHLRDSRHPSILLLEDVPPERVRNLVGEVLAHDSMTLLITRRLPADDLPLFLDDDRVHRITLGPLSSPAAFDLLQSVAGPLEWSFLEWVTNQLGRTPQLLLLAARSHKALRSGTSPIAERLGRSLEDEVRRLLGDDCVDALEVFSLLSRIRTDERGAGELEALCVALGKDALSVKRRAEDLEAAGYLVRQPGFGAVHPPFLGTWMATRTFSERPELPPILLASLREGAVLRLLERLVEFPAQDSFWNNLLGENSRFRNDADIAHGFGWLTRLAVAVPGRVADLLGRHFDALLERCSIPEEPRPRSYDEAVEQAVAFLEACRENPELVDQRDPALEPSTLRRSLILLLQVLLEFPESAPRALDWLHRLARHETETYGNNSTGLFKSAFSPYHVTVALPLFRRLEKLRSLPIDTLQDRLLLLAACEEVEQWEPLAFPAQRIHRPDEVRDRPTGPEIGDYMLAAADRAMEVLEAFHDAYYWKRVPRLLFSLGAHLGAPAALERFEKLVAWASSRPVEVSTTELLDALADVRLHLTKGLENPEPGVDRVRNIEEGIARTDRFIQSLTAASFASRLKALASPTSRLEYHEWLESSAETRFRKYLEEVAQLAEDAVSHPNQIDNTLWAWLLSREASRSGFFFQSLGEKCTGEFWLQRIARSQDCPGVRQAFLGYCRGWERRDPKAVVSYLESAPGIRPSLVAEACVSLSPSAALAQRACILFKEGGTIAFDLARNLTPDWIGGLPPAIAANLLECLRTSDPLGPALVLSALCDISNFATTRPDAPPPGPPELVETAWRCLETPPRVVDECGRDDLGWQQTQIHLSWACDTIAAQLVRVDPERAVRLLSVLLPHVGDRATWNPIDSSAPHAYWGALSRSRSEAVQAVLDAQCPEESAWLLPWHMKRILDLELTSQALTEYAVHGEERAVRVASCLQRAQKGFWELADRLLSHYPDSQPVRDALRGGLHPAIWAGTEVDVLAQLKADLANQRAHLWSPPMREWLQEVLRDLGGERPRSFWGDYDITEAELDGLLKGPDSDDRRLAVIRTLTGEPWSVVRKKLSVQDIEAVLPDLPEERRRVIETAVRVWSGGRK